MSLQVELLLEADIPAWLALAEEVSDLFGAEMAGDPAFLAWVKRSVARGDAYCIRTDGEVVGVMQYRNGWINWLAVSKRFRRRGVGRALVTHALAGEALIVRVTTFGKGHPHPDAAAARRLYQTLGFQPSDEIAEPAADGTPRAVLVWYNSHH
jgi:ribosomal protein S18 acetylase RimI-like enzyme